jgi:Pectate lyase superfamily protein
MNQHFMNQRCLLGLGLLLGMSPVLAQTAPPQRVDSTNVIFPGDAGVVDVTQAPYSANPAPGNDDTSAIQKALTDAAEGTVIYFPKGTYDISDIKLRDGTNTAAALELKNSRQRIILQGQQEGSTVLRLMDSVPNTFNAAVFSTFTGASSGNAFRNSIRNLTVNVGRNHPNATGIQYVSNNQGAVSSVTITSEDGQGATGLDVGSADTNGPALVRNLSVKGFGYGIRSRFDSSSIVFDTIDLRNQQTSGWDIQLSAGAAAHNLTSVNNVPAVWVGGSCSTCNKQGSLALSNAFLYSASAGATEPAIRNGRSLYVRDIRSFGYPRTIQSVVDFQRGNGNVNAPFVDEYWAFGAYAGDDRRGGSFELFPSPDTSLKLPVNPPPVIPWSQDFSRWAGPQQFGGVPNDAEDDTAAFTSALNKLGADTLYIPRGRWRIRGSLTIPSNITRIIGLGTRLDNATDASGTRVPAEFVIPASSSPLEITGIEGDIAARLTLRHNSNRVLHVESCLGLDYQANTNGTSGNLYLTDVSLPTLQFFGQSVWARQLNVENEVSGNDAKVTNNGGKLWILGLKTEKLGTTLKTTQGGSSEVLSALQNSDPDSTNPRFRTIDSSLFTAMIRTTGAATYSTIYSETRSGQTRTYPSATFPSNNANTYSGFSAAAIRNREVILDANEFGNTALAGTWTPKSGSPGGFLNSNFLFDGDDSNRGKKATFIPDLPANGQYEIFARWPNEISGFNQSGKVRYRITTTAGASEVFVNQKQILGTWFSLGTFNLNRTTARLEVFNNSSTQGQGNTIVDGIRFLRK